MINWLIGLFFISRIWVLCCFFVVFEVFDGVMVVCLSMCFRVWYNWL